MAPHYFISLCVAFVFATIDTNTVRAMFSLLFSPEKTGETRKHYSWEWNDRGLRSCPGKNNEYLFWKGIPFTNDFTCCILLRGFFVFFFVFGNENAYLYFVFWSCEFENLPKNIEDYPSTGTHSQETPATGPLVRTGLQRCVCRKPHGRQRPIRPMKPLADFGSQTDGPAAGILL